MARDEVCRGVETEPGLLPVEPENFEKGAITGDMACLDIVATGLFGNMEKTYFGVRVTHSNAPSYYEIVSGRYQSMFSVALRHQPPLQLGQLWLITGVRTLGWQRKRG